MARIRIDVPDSLPFETEITLYLSHMNYGNHLDNALLLTLVSEARARYLGSLGCTELDVGGVGIIVADAALQYRSEAHHGEVMRVGMGAADFTDSGCDLVWRMAERGSGREVARGKTGIVCFDYRARAVADMPQDFRRKLMAGAGRQASG